MNDFSCAFCGLVPDAGQPVCTSQKMSDTACPNEVEDRMVGGPLDGLKRGHYRAIYADPPWSYKTFSKPKEGTVPHRSAEEPYKTMTREELLDMPVGQIAAKDCILHLWTISSHVDQAFELAAAWGFTFKTLGFVWVKTQKGDPDTPKMGMGKWLRQESELCLIFTRGKPTRTGAGVRQVLMEPAREHSRKPDGFYDRIEELTDGPYCELFSRTSRPGWGQMGNQLGKFDINKRLEADPELTRAYDPTELLAAAAQMSVEEYIESQEIADLI